MQHAHTFMENRHTAHHQAEVPVHPEIHNGK